MVVTGGANIRRKKHIIGHILPAVSTRLPIWYHFEAKLPIVDSGVPMACMVSD
jgi:hypothetical protein